jgi:hypothetical protein
MKTKIKDVKTGKILEVADPEKFMQHREAVLVDGKVEEAPEVEEDPEVEDDS